MKTSLVAAAATGALLALGAGSAHAQTATDAAALQEQIQALQAQVQALRLAGASHLQGYYFARPMPAEAAREMAEAGLGWVLEDEAEPDSRAHG